MAEKRLLHVEKSLSQQISVFSISRCKILKFSIFLLAYPVLQRYAVPNNRIKSSYQVLPCFYESVNAILLNNMTLFLHKKGKFLPSFNSSNFQDGGPFHEVAKCMMG